jgi:hypothetical protein
MKILSKTILRPEFNLTDVILPQKSLALFFQHPILPYFPALPVYIGHKV